MLTHEHEARWALQWQGVALHSLSSSVALDFQLSRKPLGVMRVAQGTTVGVVCRGWLLPGRSQRWATGNNRITGLGLQRLSCFGTRVGSVAFLLVRVSVSPRPGGHGAGTRIAMRA